jgi:DNA-directed RNA polymerase subunit RPC12/RpoP
MPKCEDCGKEFDSQSGLSTHRTHKHDDSSLVELECKWCGEGFEEYESQLENEQRNCERGFCSRDCYDEWQREARQGENNSQWRGGKKTYECDWCGEEFKDYQAQRERHSTDFCSWVCFQEYREENSEGRPYYGPNWMEVRDRIKERDGVCQICGEDGSSSILDVHHIEPLRSFDNPEDANHEDNLVLLCRQHHKQVELGQLACPDPEVERQLINSASEADW